MAAGGVSRAVLRLPGLGVLARVAAFIVLSFISIRV